MSEAKRITMKSGTKSSVRDKQAWETVTFLDAMELVAAFVINGIGANFINLKIWPLASSPKAQNF